MPPVVWTLAAFAMRSFAGSFLTPAVLMTLGAALFAYIALGQPGSAYLAAVLRTFLPEASADLEIGTDELMLAYSMLSLVVGLISAGISTLARRLLGPGAPSARSGLSAVVVGLLKSGFFFISIVFTAALLLIPSIRIADGSSPLFFYLFFLVVYLISMVCYGLYYGISYAADYLPGQRRSPVVQASR